MLSLEILHFQLWASPVFVVLLAQLTFEEEHPQKDRPLL
jgi:hypothetical protein